MTSFGCSLVKEIANPKGHVVLGEEEVYTAEARYVALEAELQALRLCNEELMCRLQEQENIVAVERLGGDRRSRAQMQEFINLTTELLVERRGPKVQLEGMRLGLKVEKADMYGGTKGRDPDTWLFQVREHLNLTIIPKQGHVSYVASLLCGNATLWWHKTCEANHRPAMWEDFCRVLCEQFQPEDYSCHGRDELAGMRQYGKESMADFVSRFCATCLKIQDLLEAEKMDRFVRTLVPEVRLHIELWGPLNFYEAPMHAEHANTMITHVYGQDTRNTWQKSSKGGFYQRPPVQVQPKR